MQSKYRKINYLISLLFFFISFSLPKSIRADVPYYVLPEYKLDKMVELNTNWHFFWQKTYNDYQTDTSLVGNEIVAPRSWTSINYPASGYGLFVLKVVSRHCAGNPIAIKIPAVCTSFNLLADGIKIAHAGEVGTSDKSTKSDYNPQVVVFTPLKDTIELAFEVANYNYRVSGIDSPISIGSIDTINKSFNLSLYFAAFVSGALMLMFFYFIGFYFVRKIDLTALYFSLLCLFSAIRIMSTGGVLIRQLTLPISWQWLVNIELISIVLIPMFGGLYLFSLINQPKFKSILYLFTGVSALLALYVLVMDTYYDSLVVPPFLYYVFAQMLFLFFVSLYTLIQRRTNVSLYAFLAYLVVFVAGINDILYSKLIVDTAFVLPYAILFYVVLQAIMMSRHIAFSFNKVEELSSQLASANKNQEQIISARTAELHQQSVDLQKYNEVKDKIMSIIAHDLRSPIASLSSVITLAEIGDADDLETIRTFFNSVKPHIDNLNLTIDNLFLWAHNQINSNTLNATNLPLNSAIARVKPLYELVAKQKEVTIVNLAKEPLVVRADSSHLELVLRNLISNALKFSNKSGKVEIYSKVVANNMVEVAIKDSGVGISQENINSIFDSKIHYTTYGTSNEKGTGLGLRLCKEYVEFNGGTISMESELGKGTTVRFTLPMPKG